MTRHSGRRFGRRGARSSPWGLARRAGWLLLLPLLVACIDETREKELGNAIASEINTHIPLIGDPALLFYVDRLGQQLVEVSERPEIRYHFYIVNTDAVNAFALPGGHIYLTRGLIERTDDATQLAGVLAHEIGHVAARHGAQALERELRTGSVVSMLYNLFFGREPALLENAPVDLGTRLWHARHSRAAEREADQLAVRYLVNSGVDPGGMIVLLRGLLEEEHEQQRVQVEWFSSHPMTANRIRLLQRKIGRLSPEVRRDLAQEIPLFDAFRQRLDAMPRPIFIEEPPADG